MADGKVPECMKGRVLMGKDRSKLANHLVLSEDRSDNGDVFDNYPFNELIDWNYYERYMKGEIKKYQTGWVKPGDYETKIIEK